MYKNRIVILEFASSSSGAYYKSAVSGKISVKISQTESRNRNMSRDMFSLLIATR